MVADEAARLDRRIRVMELMGEVEAERDAETGRVIAYRRTEVPSPVLDDRSDSTVVQLGGCQSGSEDHAVRKRGTGKKRVFDVSITVRMVIAMGAIQLAVSLGCDYLPSRPGAGIPALSVLAAPFGQPHHPASVAQS